VGVLKGTTLGQTLIGIIGLFVVVLVMTFKGVLDALIPFGVLLAWIAMIVFRDKDQLSVSDRLMERIGFMMKSLQGQRTFRSGPLSRVPHGNFRLPGLLADSRMWAPVDPWGNECALVEHRSLGSWSIIINACPPGVGLIKPTDIDRQIGHWGNWLANSADIPNIESVQCVLRAAPDTGELLAGEVNRRVNPAAPEFACQVMSDVIRESSGTASSVHAWVVITVKPRKGKAGKAGAEAVWNQLSQSVQGWCEHLGWTGMGVARPATPSEIAEMVKIAYDPLSEALITEARAGGAPVRIAWEDVGPSAAQADWDSYRHDSHTSQTIGMTLAPRSLVTSRVLEPLLRPHLQIPMKRVALVFTPIPPSSTPEVVEKERDHADQQASQGRRPSGRAQKRQMDAKIAADEEARGAGLVLFSILATATWSNDADAEAVKEAFSGLPPASHLRMRPLFNAHDSGFAATLPLGVCLGHYSSLPQLKAM
jgi:hypothetical protein